MYIFCILILLIVGTWIAISVASKSHTVNAENNLQKHIPTRNIAPSNNVNIVSNK